MSRRTKHSRGAHPARPPRAQPRPPKTRRLRRVLIGVVLAAVTVGVVIAVCLFSREPTPAQALHFDMRIPTPDTSAMEPRVRTLIEQSAATVRANFGSAQAWGRFGAVFDAHELLAEAEHCYRNACALAPDDFRWQYLLAQTAEMRGGDPAEVIGAYRAAAAMEPEFPPVFYRMGEAYARQGWLAEARTAYERARTLDPTLAVAHRALAQVLLSQGQIDQAIGHFNQAEALVPGDAAVYAGLAQAFLRRGDAKRAQQAAQRSRSGQRRLLALPDPVRYLVNSMGISSQLCFDRAKQHLQSGDFAAAIADFRIAEEARPNDPGLHRLLGRAYAGNGQPELAQQHRLKSIRLDEEPATAHRKDPRHSPLNPTSVLLEVERLAARGGFQPTLPPCLRRAS